ncbi:hypothetical protein AB0D78_34935 [Streptomyces avermitilis]|uniref:hypothetical protein n=1 Tax=Streptomyces avermitilis TaxID=33903 RepID=UPI0033F68F57
MPRETTEAIIGAITGTLAAPRTLLLARYDTSRRLQYIGRTTTLTPAASSTIAPLLTAATAVHPGGAGRSPPDGAAAKRWTSRSLNRTWLGEVGVDVARDSVGRWRHPVRWHRPRTDLSPADIPHTAT